MINKTNWLKEKDFDWLKNRCIAHNVYKDNVHSWINYFNSHINKTYKDIKKIRLYVKTLKKLFKNLKKIEFEAKSEVIFVSDCLTMIFQNNWITFDKLDHLQKMSKYAASFSNRVYMKHFNVQSYPYSNLYNAFLNQNNIHTIKTLKEVLSGKERYLNIVDFHQFEATRTKTKTNPKWLVNYISNNDLVYVGKKRNPYDWRLIYNPKPLLIRFLDTLVTTKISFWKED
ncbi:Hypothetical protein MAU_1700 [Metamycoplasma auris 15026]|uniref:Uncharacterized protein n=1 Tax=Metamycoplasma auris 15026 TaxID=1188233 RepID=N9TSK1_9BACT|nr:hypothetical protein [Metamycoplasma auris]ENY69129.1 Hypothetical protein MAU_1700 [Metamycoplasma auris 15026]